MATILVMGCDSGPKLGTVRGLVTYDGEPLTGVSVEFSPQGEGRSSFGQTNDNGEYSLRFTRDKKGALLGVHRVSVHPDDKPIRIPAKYGSKSDLQFEVKSGANNYNIDIVSQP